MLPAHCIEQHCELLAHGEEFGLQEVPLPQKPLVHAFEQHCDGLPQV